MNKRERLIPKPKPKVRHLSHGLTLIESILMQHELNEYSIIYRLYMCSVLEEGRLCEQLQVWELEAEAEFGQPSQTPNSTIQVTKVSTHWWQ